jgi:signal transduction histidine kinase
LARNVNPSEPSGAGTPDDHLQGPDPTVIPRLVCAFGVAALLTLGVAPGAAATWFAAALLGELTVGLIGRTAFASGNPSRTAHIALGIAIFTVTTIWTVPAILLWTTNNAAFQIAAESILAVQLFHASTFAYRDRISIVICGVPPAIAIVAMPTFLSHFPVSAQATLIAVSAGAVLYAAYVARVNFGMLQTLVETQKNLRHITEAANAANVAKTNFLSNMSHELRTPLNAILGFSELLGNDKFTQNRAEYAQVINESGQHLLMLINDILDLAKIEAGKMELQEKKVDISAIIRDCVHMMQAKADAGHVSLSSDIDPALPRLRGDERALRQIMLNLVSNALKFTPDGGSVRVFARIEQSGAIALGVADTGVGIPLEDQARVFENFGQGRHDAVHADKGTGLGLPIVKGLAGAHGGRVELQSETGKGTCVTVVLPSERIVLAEEPSAHQRSRVSAAG